MVDKSNQKDKVLVDLNRCCNNNLLDMVYLNMWSSLQDKNIQQDKDIECIKSFQLGNNNPKDTQKDNLQKLDNKILLDMNWVQKLLSQQDNKNHLDNCLMCSELMLNLHKSNQKGKVLGCCYLKDNNNHLDMVYLDKQMIQLDNNNQQDKGKIDNLRYQ